ncbi:hypothetical protein [Brucella sp. IR073]|uniref:hypothetical protein n=1 Tax=unclassified Brucella TaxID=2632610 RepID=UPI003B981E14
MPIAEPAAETIARRRAASQCSPEEIFIAWLLWLPKEADMAAAAAEEIRRLDRYQGPLTGPLRLREMFVTLVASLEGALH